jgi:hypothetical protein
LKETRHVKFLKGSEGYSRVHKFRRYMRVRKDWSLGSGRVFKIKQVDKQKEITK